MNTSEENSCSAPPCEQPAPAPEHAWLHQFVGEWESEVEVPMGPGKEPMRFQGKETARMIGEFWLVSNYRSETPFGLFQSMLTIGYDIEAAQYMVSWIDSGSAHFWRTPGIVSAAGDSITMECDGPSPMGDGVRTFREIYQFMPDGTRRFSSSVLDDGEWKTCVAIKSRRIA